MSDLSRCVCGSLHLTTNPEGCQHFTAEEEDEE